MATVEDAGDEAPERLFTRAEVAALGSADSIVFIIGDDVYDATEYAARHPGGADVLLSFTGRDATSAFKAVNHGSRAIIIRTRYKIGALVPHERVPD